MVWVDEDRSQQSGPLPLIDEHDGCFAIRDLTAQHRSNIDEIQANLEQQEECDLYDSACAEALRFLLSHKTVNKATAAAKIFVESRVKKGLEDIDISSEPPGRDCSNEAVREFYACSERNDALSFCLPDPYRGVVVLSRLASINQDKLATMAT
jgi:hypothetical protein